ncbi:WYL domain-containing protein [Dactylosporangium sp. AC04546]|uniref:helix-turn-helix transcriptional regulator n=1 Tax=Dactylosporangium sp. AC04546 TaxID=2862460 RepID=UPI001EDE6EF2|nr:WYL domain-containing protein [Dactylosporangium sp. AC04546]WVK87980.1 WYL domain-containing protein [Dactylosporangium sp. AC04546]
MSRFNRLEALKGLLADRDVTTAGELAAELGVSVRTLQRDLATLRDLGTPIDGDRGRGGGLRLERGWSLGRVHLNESEAMGMLLSLTIAEKIGSPLLLDDLRSVTRKVGAAFAPAQARRIMGLRRRILVGSTASAQVLASYRPPGAHVTRPLLDAFLHQRLLRITYEDQYGAATERDIEAQYLYYNLPVWYALAWDRLREDVRFFRVDRIRAARTAGGGFRLRRADAFLSAGEAETRSV